MTAELERRIRAFVQRRVPDAEVDDVVQEIFLRLAKGTDHVEHLSGFAHRIARSAVADHHRRRARGPDLSGLEEEPPHPDEPAFDESVAAEVASWLGPLVEDLDEPYATTLRLTELEGRGHDEVARELGLARSTVSSRVQKGRELLRQALVRCCSIALDARGAVIDWEPRRSSCCD